jgi:hypothetical protein
VYYDVLYVEQAVLLLWRLLCTVHRAQTKSGMAIQPVKSAPGARFLAHWV